MSLRQKVRLDYELDGQQQELVVEYSAIDLRAWETKHGKSSLEVRLSISMLTWLGHHAAVRQGLLDGPLKEYAAFDEVCDSVEGVADVRPTKQGGRTQKAPGGASSAP